MTTVGSVTIEIDGNSYRFNREMRQAEAQAMRSNRRIRGEFQRTGLAAETMASSISRAKGAIVTFGAVAAGAVTVGAIGKFQQFEKTMSEVKAVTQATGKDFDRLTKRARELGATTTFAASEVAQGMAELGRAGLNVEQIIATIPTTLQLAQAGVLDLGTASDIMTNVAQGFQITADEATRVGDVLAKTASRSNTDIQGLGYAMAYAAPLSKAFGLSLEESAAAIGLFSNNGIKGSAAGTGLRQVLVQLHKETPKGTKLLKKYGLTYADLNVEARGFLPVLESLAKANISASDASKIFQARAAGGITILSRQLEAFKELNEQTHDYDGTLNDMSSTLTDNLYGAVKEFTSAWEDLMISLGKSIEAEEKIRGLTGALQDFNNFVKGPETETERLERQTSEYEKLVRRRIEAERKLGEERDKADGKINMSVRLAQAEVFKLRGFERAKRAEIELSKKAVEDRTEALRRAAQAQQDQVGKVGFLDFIGGAVSGQPAKGKGTEDVIEATTRLAQFRFAVADLYKEVERVDVMSRLGEEINELNNAPVEEIVTQKIMTLQEALANLKQAGYGLWGQRDLQAMVDLGNAADALKDGFSGAADAIFEAADGVAELFKQASDQTSFDLELAQQELRNAEVDGDKEAITLAQQKVEQLREELRLEQEIADLKRDGFSDERALELAERRVKALKEAGSFKVTPEETNNTDILKDFGTDVRSITKRGVKEAMVDGDWQEAFEKGIAGAAAAGMEKGIDAILDTLFDVFAKGLGGGGGGGLLAGFFGGFRASGGPVSSSKAYVVGEQGPELFMPDRGGHIIPNGAPVIAGGGGAVGVTINAPFIVHGSITDDTRVVVREELATHMQSLPKMVQTEVKKGQSRGRF